MRKSFLKGTKRFGSKASVVLPLENVGKSSSALVQAMSHVKEFMTDSQKAFILLREGKLLMDTGDFRGAIDCFNEGVSFNPNAVSLYNMKAACHKALEMHTEAYFDYSFTIRLEPDVGAHYCARGLCLARLKKASMAIEDLDVAVQLDPTPVHYYARAITFAEFGKFELSINDFTAAIGDDTLSASANELQLKCKFKRSLAYFELRRFDDVVRDCTAVLHLDPNNIATRALLGRALKVLNEHKRAEEQLSFALQLDDSQAALYIERGDIRFRTGQKNKVIEAVYDLDKAVKLLEAKLATRFAGQESLSSARVFGKLNRSASFNLCAGTTSGGSQQFQTKSLTSAVGGVEGSLPSLMAAANAVRSSLGLSLRKIDESDDDRAVDMEGRERDCGSPLSPSRPIARLALTQTALSTAPLLPPLTIAGRPSLARSGSVSSSISKELAFGAAPGAGLSAAYYREVEEQLADALYKRAQAKLMVDASSANIEAALSDAIKSSAYQPDDDDYQMVIATCYIRLHRYNDALRVLSHILERSPDNHKALYNYSFCQRAGGQQRDAIEGLTKIIAQTEKQQQQRQACRAEGDVLAPSLPIHRVFEMRGTLLHEMQAHKLALHDLGRAIAINPTCPDNYYLRGDCQCKLGNYEQALADFNLAEQKKIEDMVALLAARGNCKRLLGDSQGAALDFSNAYQQLERNDKVGRVRILSFRAFCQIDQQMFATAHDSLIVAQQFNSELMAEKMTSLTAERGFQRQIAEKGEASVDVGREDRTVLSPAESDLLYLNRVDWILQYHIALCQYMQHMFTDAESTLLRCVGEESLKFVPDDLALGTLRFFLALAQMQLKKFGFAEASLVLCGQTHWIDSGHNNFLFLYVGAKLCQCQGNHAAAVEKFSAALAVSPANPYCHFKRAWSFKAMGNFSRAGEDFEEAKALRPLDPNFAVDYRRISGMQYMVIGSEPDLVEPLPPLLLVPGMAVR